jgi:glycosyltransferase involved in cell wall biosynthesis
VNERIVERTISVVGVVLPVHDEETLLPGALEAIEGAVAALPAAIKGLVAVVLDDCRDGSAATAVAWAIRVGAVVLRQDCRNVGSARAQGAQALLGLWPEENPAQTWLATTDADSRVPNDWLTAQLEAYRTGTDLWAGRVSVSEESTTARLWRERYAAEGDPIHGANLGFSAALYRELGGFCGLRTGEDRDLYVRAAAAGFRIAHDPRATVMTSSRKRGRAPEGFAAALHVAEKAAPRDHLVLLRHGLH